MGTALSSAILLFQNSSKSAGCGADGWIFGQSNTAPPKPWPSLPNRTSSSSARRGTRRIDHGLAILQRHPRFANRFVAARLYGVVDLADGRRAVVFHRHGPGNLLVGGINAVLVIRLDPNVLS